MVTGSLNIAESEFSVSHSDGWMEIRLSDAARYVLRGLMRDAIRAASYRDEDHSANTVFFMISVFSRVAVAISQSDTIRRISNEDVEALLWIQSLRNSKLGDHIRGAWNVTPTRSCPHSVNPVFTDMVAKGFEATLSD